MRRCPRCDRPAPAGARFCPSCGQALDAATRAVDRERRRVTAVFVDLVGSTAGADGADPEDVGGILERYYEAVAGELGRRGGTLEKYIGDAVVALFGAPVAHEDDEARAVAAAVAARDAVRALEEDEAQLALHVRVGVATGEALVAVDSPAERGDNLAAGDVMNTAARLQSAAPADGVVVDPETAAAVERSFRLEPLGEVELKGKRDPVPLYLVAGGAGVASRPLLPSRLVGRGRDLAELEAVLTTAATEGRGRVVAVVGEAGIGKTRLLAELEARSPARWIHGTCLAHGEGITYWPLARALAEAATPAGAELDAVAGLVARLTEARPAGERAAVAAAVGVAFGAPLDGGGEPAPITHGELHWGLRRVLELLAAEHPLVLVVEDVHWAEPALVELVGSLADCEAPLAVVVTARPEGTDALEGAAPTRIVLGALRPAETATLVEELLDAHELEEAVRDELVERSAGNPLFVHELARAARADGAAAAREVPRTLGALIGSRLDRLPRDVRALAGTASVVGTVFWDGAVRALAQDGDGTGPLVAAELAVPRPRSLLVREQELAFVHGLLRDVAYARLPRARRAVLHAACARWLSDRTDDRDELVELVAVHLEQACLLGASLARPPLELPVDQAVSALVHGALRAERREGFAEAARFVTRALEVKRAAGAGPSRQLRLHLARLSVALGDLGAAATALDGLAAEARGASDARGEAAALVLRANARYKLGLPEEAREDALAARRTAAALGDAELEARAGFELAMLLDVYEGDPRGALDVLGEALVAADRAGAAALAVEGRLRMGFLLYDTGDLTGSEAVLRRVIASAEEIGYRREAARARFELAVVRSNIADDGEPEALAADAYEVAVRVDDAYFVPQVARFRSDLALWHGDVETAERHARAALDAARRIGGWSVVNAGAALVRALVRAGAADEGETVLSELRAALPPADEHASAEALAAEATVLAARGGYGAARRAFEEAVRLTDGLENPLASALMRWQVARALPLDDPGIARLLEQAAGIWTAHGAHRLAAEAAALRAGARA